jgi:DNA-directed RNA polymerase subunit F
VSPERIAGLNKLSSVEEELAMEAKKKTRRTPLLPLTPRWMEKMARVYPEWEEALRCVRIMKTVSKRSMVYYAVQYTAVVACVRALLTMPRYSLEEIEDQREWELINNMRDAVNYTREFKYDVLTGYLNAFSANPYRGRLD